MSQRVEIVVGNDNNTTVYHTDPDCHIAARYETREVALETRPHLDECGHCAGGGPDEYVGESDALKALKAAAAEVDAE